MVCKRQEPRVRGRDASGRLLAAHGPGAAGDPPGRRQPWTSSSTSDISPFTSSTEKKAFCTRRTLAVSVRTPPVRIHFNHVTSRMNPAIQLSQLSNNDPEIGNGGTVSYPEALQKAIGQLQEQIDIAQEQILEYNRSGQDAQPVVYAQKMLQAKCAFLHGDFASSRAAYTESLEGFHERGMNRMRASVALQAAQLYFQKGKPEALEFCETAIDSIDAMWWNSRPADRLKVPEIAARVYDVGVKIAHASNRSDLAFKYIQMAKARWLLETLTLKHIGQQPMFKRFRAMDPQKKRESEYQRTFHQSLSELDECWMSYLSNPTPALESKLRNSERQVLDAYDPLEKTASGNLRIITASVSTLDQVQSRLAPGEALMELFVQTDGIYTFLITRERARSHYHEISSAQLGEYISAWYVSVLRTESRRIALQGGTGTGGNASNVIRWIESFGVNNSQLLYDLIIRPIERSLHGIRRLVVCPHWHLHIVPFHALQFSLEERDDYLIQSMSITYCPSASIWERLSDIKQERTASKANGPCLVVGVEKEAGDGIWNTLVEAAKDLIGLGTTSDFEEEANSIAKTLKSTPLLGDDATKHDIINGLINSSKAHLSCHSVLDRTHPLLDGLLLADGVLTLAEILTNEKLEDACPSIVCASACRSGLSRVDAGDRFLGIGHGCLVRFGCPILSTLWPVDAESTRALMERLYSFGGADNDWAVRLQKAQCLTINSRSRPDRSGNTVCFYNPYYWAGFFVIGP